jgi:F-type H+-transporting ATPase subunit b
MQIDWLTVAAQIVNFLVLVWLLQRFLYGPIIRAIQQRESRIEERLADARAQRENAEEEARSLKRKQADLDARVDEIIDDARQEAKDLRRDNKQKIEEEAEARRAALRERIEAESEDALQEIRKRAAASTFTVIRDTLRDFAGGDLSEELADRFARHLADLPEDDRDRLAKAADEAEKPAHVYCAPDLSATTRAKLTRAIQHTIARDLDVTYASDPDLLLGLRLDIAGQTVDWSVKQHLDRLESEVREALTNAAPFRPQKDAA